MQGLDKISEILITPKLPGWVVAIKVFFIVFGLLLLAGIIYFAIFTDYFYYRFFESLEDWYEFKRRKNIRKNIIQRKEKEKKKEIINISPWERISTRIKKGGKTGPKLSLLDADKLLNQKLEDLGYEGRDLKEKLKNLDKKILPNLEDLKKARSLLEEILAEKRKVKEEEIREAFEVYKKAYDHLSGKFVKSLD